MAILEDRELAVNLAGEITVAINTVEKCKLR